MFELIVFGGVTFYVLLSIVFLLCAVVIFNGGDIGALIVATLAGLAAYICVGEIPPLQWWHVPAYLAVGVVWMPIYWVLEIRENAKQLKDILADHPDIEWSKHGTKTEDGAWLPNHPDMDRITVSVILWPVHAPVFILRDSIEFVALKVKSLMDKVREQFKITPDAND